MRGLERSLRVVVVVVPLLAAASPAAARVKIPIDDITFKKPAVTVQRGERVIWKDRERFTTHTVTSRGEDRFKSSGLLQAGDVHRVRFQQRGEYRYVCRVHPNMKGRITVK